MFSVYDNAQGGFLAIGEDGVKYYAMRKGKAKKFATSEEAANTAIQHNVFQMTVVPNNEPDEPNE